MAKFKVLKKFRDIHTKDVYDGNSEIEMTVKRSEEVAKNLDESYLERLDAPEDKAKDDKSKEADK